RWTSPRRYPAATPATGPHSAARRPTAGAQSAAAHDPSPSDPPTPHPHRDPSASGRSSGAPAPRTARAAAHPRRNPPPAPPRRRPHPPPPRRRGAPRFAAARPPGNPRPPGGGRPAGVRKGHRSGGVTAAVNVVRAAAGHPARRTGLRFDPGLSAQALGELLG